MSFSFEQKNAIISQHYKSACCRRAMLMGVLFSKANVCGDSVKLHIEREEVAEFISKLIREFYTKSVRTERSEYGGRFIEITFQSSSASDYVLNISSGHLFAEKCPSCLSSFLRGVFLASGKISDPDKQYSMEFSLGERAIYFADILSEYGIIPLISYKKSGTVAYFKNSAMIEEFCALVGLNKVVFALLNARAEGELRQSVSRRTNCETNNIAKAIDAAAKQIDVISRLEEAKLLSSLPEELAETARLRLAHSDMSLSQLAALSVPPISKPGLSHRLKKIMELGTQLLDAKEKP